MIVPTPTKDVKGVGTYVFECCSKYCSTGNKEALGVAAVVLTNNHYCCRRVTGMIRTHTHVVAS